MSTQTSSFSSLSHRADFDGDEANFNGGQLDQVIDRIKLILRSDMTAVEKISLIRVEYNLLLKDEDEEEEEKEIEIEAPKLVTMIQYTMPPKDKKQKRVKPEMFDYLVLNVGYSKRLVKHMPAIQNEIVEVDPSLKLLAAYDYSDSFKPPHDLYLYGEPDQAVVKELINLADGVGAMYFQGHFNHVDALGVQDVLKQFDHCAGFCHPNCIRRYFNSSGQKVLIMDYDTESG